LSKNTASSRYYIVVSSPGIGIDMIKYVFL